ncbi:DNA repair and recombination protein RAD54-like [Euphorbia peplus]|nr:DNA repair and recombination protein RAD54-like [Euphorbia peplus]
MSPPISSRTRQRDAFKFRKLHEQILKNKPQNDSFSTSRRSRDLKISSISSCNDKPSSDSFRSYGRGRGRGRGRGKGKRRNGSFHYVCGDDDDDDIAGDFDLGVSDNNAYVFDLGSSNLESYGFGVSKKSGATASSSDKSRLKSEVEEISSGPKCGGFDDRIIDISDGSLDFSSGGNSGNEDDGVVVISGGEVSSSSSESDEDTDDEDYKAGNFDSEELLEESVSTDGASSYEELSSGDEADKRAVPIERFSERGKREDLEPTTKRFEPAFDPRVRGKREDLQPAFDPRVIRKQEKLEPFEPAFDPRVIGKREKLEPPTKRFEPAYSGKREHIEPSTERFEPAFIGKREHIELPTERFQPAYSRKREHIESPTKRFESAFGSRDRGKQEQLFEPPSETRKISEASFDSDDECDVLEVGFMSKKKQALYESKFRKKKVDIAEILGNSLFNDDDEEEEVVIPEPEPPKLPLKFTFGVEEPPPIEKSEQEIELDALWLEMQLALCGLDPTYNAPIENEAEPLEAETETAVADDCSQGKHELILDEEIGLKCKFCGFVEQEIRYHTAPFGKNPFGRSDRRGINQEQVDVSGKLDLGDDSKYGNGFNCDVRGTVWDIIPGNGKDLHPHQRDGFLFLWKNIGGGIELDKLKESSDSNKGSGCIISHAPGTGKTRLAIIFLQSYMKLYPSCKPVIIAPCGMLLYWESEFKKWNVNIPFHNLNNSKLSGKENTQAIRIARGGPLDRKCTRMMKLYSWKKDRSVLALSYQLFKELVGEDEQTKGKKMRLKTRDAKVQKLLLEVPNLLFLDEGHTPRNEKSQIWRAFEGVRTKKRIILSGTPFQNTFDELYNTIRLVRPQSDLFPSELNECLADRRLKHCEKKLWNSLVGPIGKEHTNAGQEAKRLRDLRDMIRPFVHVHEGNILQQKLPGLRDAVIYLEPGQFQKVLLDRVELAEKQTNFEMEHFISLVSLHPSLFPKKLVAKENPSEVGKLEGLRLNSDEGVKTKFLMELIRISDHLNEKILVFSQYIDPLELIRDQLVQRFKWSEDREILSMDGKTTAVDRQSKIKIFNNTKSEAKVMLASTKACSEGISLVGASRVVLVDVVWNPQVERQAISRAYRLGQTKVVYVYHLITCGTKEEDKYRTQARKERLSGLVFYSPERMRNQNDELPSIVSDKILESIVDGKKLEDILKDIRYEPKANLNDDMLNL